MACSGTTGVSRVALLCAVVLLSGGGAAPGAAARHRPVDLATGSDGKGGDATRFVLAGARLTITLPVPVVEMAREDTSGDDPHPLRRTGPRLRVAAWCGDDASFDGRAQSADATWADVTRARLRVVRAARRIHVVLPRDVARRVNQCGFEVRPGSYYATGRSGAMVLRRGTRVGCRPNRRERVIVREGRIRVTYTRLSLGDRSYQTAYRACLAPRQELRPIERGGVFSVGSGGGTRRAALFRAAGTWLAWTNIAESNSQGPEPPGIWQLDLRATGRPRSFNPASGSSYYGGGQVTQLAIARDGTLVWILDQQRGLLPPSDLPAFPALLYARRPGGRRVRLDQAPSAAGLGIPTISLDGRTIAWTHDGAARSHTLSP